MTTKTQHKPKRDNQKARELSDLKSENHSLRRTVSRLRKELERQQDLELEAMDTNELYGIPEMPKCIRCESKQIVIYQTPLGTLLNICKDCKFRKLIDS